METVNLEVDPRMTAASMLTHGGHATPASAPTGAPWAGLDRHADQASDLLKRLFCGFGGSLALRLWSGATLSLGKPGPEAAEPRFTLVCRHPSVVRALVLGGDRLRIPEAYFRGDIYIEGDFFAALSLKDHLNAIRLSARDRLFAVLGALRLPAFTGTQLETAIRPVSLHGRAVKAHSKAENRNVSMTLRHPGILI